MRKLCKVLCHIYRTLKSKEVGGGGGGLKVIILGGQRKGTSHKKGSSFSRGS